MNPRSQADAFAEECRCPKCGNDECFRDEVDVGVGVIFGPWGCPMCGWSEHPDYDLSEGRSPVRETGAVIDQYGGLHPAGSSMARAGRLAEEARQREERAHDDDAQPGEPDS